MRNRLSVAIVLLLAGCVHPQSASPLSSHAPPASTQGKRMYLTAISAAFVDENYRKDAVAILLGLAAYHDAKQQWPDNADKFVAFLKEQHFCAKEQAGNFSGLAFTKIKAKFIDFSLDRPPTPRAGFRLYRNGEIEMQLPKEIMEKWEQGDAAAASAALEPLRRPTQNEPKDIMGEDFWFTLASALLKISLSGK